MILPSCFSRRALAWLALLNLAVGCVLQPASLGVRAPLAEVQPRPNEPAIVTIAPLGLSGMRLERPTEGEMGTRAVEA